jgi:hypothetical protein
MEADRRASVGTDGSMRTALLGAALLVVAQFAHAELPQYADAVHEGVATCASSVCHGSATERSGTSVLQNEFVTWTRYDAHAGAYALLKNEESRRIARNLGLPNAHEADICLDCHADNVPAERRGEEFRIEDGIGCEACHGGAEDWMGPHTADGNTHADNIANGMYPTDDVEARAELCLSCHLGTEDKFATHEIMGAGHPRLAFELSTFQALEPPHWAFDDDYERRKGVTDEFTTWIRGLITAARQNVDLIGGPLMHGSGLFPEIGLFDCHSCHHPMSEQRWARTAFTQGLAPGVVRLNDANFVLLLPIAEVLAPALHGRMLQQIRALNAAVAKGRAAMDAAAGVLAGSIDELEQAVAAGADAPTRRAVLVGVMSRAIRGDYRDYVAAEQAAMAMDLLLISLGQWEANQSRIDAVFATVSDDEAFRPARFAAAVDGLRQAL